MVPTFANATVIKGKMVAATYRDDSASPTYNELCQQLVDTQRQLDELWSQTDIERELADIQRETAEREREVVVQVYNQLLA